jgi:3-phenylpropionate/cinnamic acid dioxygenase small subunit
MRGLNRLDDATAIANLLYRYAELIDSGDLEGAAELFRRARVRARTSFEGEPHDIGHEELLAHWRRVIRIYPSGTPLTRHLITNPIIETGPDGSARCRSYYTVLQSAEGFLLQPIAAGRYHDRFACDQDGWYFVERDYTLMDFRGDLSRHLIASWMPSTGADEGSTGSR